MMHPASPSTFILSPVCRAVWCLFSLAALGMMYGAQVQAQVLPSMERPGQTPEEAPAILKASPLLAEKPPGGEANLPPTFVFGDNLSGRTNLDTVIDGNAELRRGTKAIRADRIEFYQPDNTVKARGNVRVSSEGNQFQGQELQIQMDNFEGYFTQPSYRFLSNGGNGQARQIDFINDKRLVAHQATFTTCERNDEATWSPAWVISGTSFQFDTEEQIGVAKGAVLRFKDVPILAFPTISFPLSDKRKSGLLPPSFTIDSTSGAGISLPYYFDIAPNRDATVTPTVMSKRGVDLGGEFRYLERDYSGKLRANFLPSDKLRDNNNRWSYSLQQTGTVKTGLAAVGNLGLNLNLNRVSDHDYARDFPRSSASLTQTLLANDASLSWSRGYFSTAIRALKWQTLQDPLAPIVPPYDRLPQITARYARINAPVAGLNGFDWSLSGDFTRFSANSQLTLQPNSDRAVMLAQISHPWITPSGYITPKLQLHATSYSFNSPLANGSLSASRVLPTFSLDSGLQYERQASFLGRAFIQTLEPRAFYVHTPYRDQSQLPNYDSGANDFNFATVFTENAFAGNDRISDANLLTLGLTSRLLDPATGAEAVRFGVAQRLRFTDQKVALPGLLPITDRISDVLVGSSIKWVPQWSFDGTVQYNEKSRTSERSSLSARYNPGNYRVLSVSLLRQINVSNSVDVGWQWPINDLWGDKGQELGAGRGQGGGRYYTVGRLNYSVLDKKLVDGIIGLEYDGCCWIGRIALHRSRNATASTNTRILFELELVGFSRIGDNPQAVLKTNIPRYQNLRGPVTSPSRFTNYD